MKEVHRLFRPREVAVLEKLMRNRMDIEHETPGALHRELVLARQIDELMYLALRAGKMIRSTHSHIFSEIEYAVHNITYLEEQT